MLYSEFVAGTGCKENEHNLKVYRNLEVMYMNSTMSKEEIYEYGKKLVDNSKSEEQLKLEAEIKRQISNHKAEIKRYTDEIAMYREWLADDEVNRTLDALWKDSIKADKEMVKWHRDRITELKFILA